MSGTTFCEGLYELSHAYDGFIIDQWGVLHNGIEAYPGVIQCLNKLKAESKQVIVLSNSGKRADYNAERLKDLKIKASHYKAVVSAGEVVWQGLKKQNEGVFADIGKTCYLINRDHDRALLKGLDIEVTDEVEKADFLLITGVDTPHKSIEDYEPVLRKAVAKGLPAICANPDLVTLFGHEKSMGPGAVAQRYSDFGGVAHFIGKPHRPIFRTCLSMFKDVIPSRILMIGDSLYHDISGASAVNIDTAFVTSGIHSSAFKRGMAPEQKMRNMEQLVHNYGVRPTWLLDGLVWQTPESAKREKERERWTE
ncbi:MAG: TIGR01459 family HAD-type hydrolase [Pseudomonadota bacterium]